MHLASLLAADQHVWCQQSNPFFFWESNFSRVRINHPDERAAAIRAAERENEPHVCRRLTSLILHFLFKRQLFFISTVFQVSVKTETPGWFSGKLTLMSLR